ncbi:tail fiber assembly protein [Enterobacter roggenkampii]|uniref:tail fiber assembly protein n=1 Tax=Enterobacter roggenkampii TaxID=1812935 RepID=UPI0032AEF3C1
MATTYVYSASKDAFFPIALREIYELAGTWPEDGVETGDDVFKKFTDTPPDGKVRGGGKDGKPTWVDAPEPTNQQLLDAVKLEQQYLLGYADLVTADWRTELSLGEINDEDKKKLSQWMAYKRQVKAIRAEDAIADGFQWPLTPEQ